jgi:hypothetical protein
MMRVVLFDLGSVLVEVGGLAEFVWRSSRTSSWIAC